MKLIHICFIFLVILLTSCGTTDNKNDVVAPSAPVVSDEIEEVQVPELEGVWELISFEKSGDVISIVPDTAPNVIGVTFQLHVSEEAPDVPKKEKKNDKNDKNNKDVVFDVKAFAGVNLFAGSATIDEEKESLAFGDFTLANAFKRGPDEHTLFEEIFKDSLFSANKISLSYNDNKDYTDREECLIIYNTVNDSVLRFKKLN